MVIAASVYSMNNKNECFVTFFVSFLLFFNTVTCVTCVCHGIIQPLLWYAKSLLDKGFFGIPSMPSQDRRRRRFHNSITPILGYPGVSWLCRKAKEEPMRKSRFSLTELSISCMVLRMLRIYTTQVAAGTFSRITYIILMRLFTSKWNSELFLSFLLNSFIFSIKNVLSLWFDYSLFERAKEDRLHTKIPM